ncbi:glutamate--cysteine ligase [Amycolatopsis sp. NPDC051758]|uniref:glutamate--cysteine ligase n=1 Tax=Amycolatopsis sp. NPDC051758 TaxID=3363935 RepID=UPI00378E7FAD
MNEPTGDVLTFGIEEEFFVVDRRGHLSQAGDDVVDAAEATADDQGDLQHELTRSQAEAATDVCRTHTEALRQLRSMRGDLAGAARRRGLRLLPAAAPLLAPERLPIITPNPRYERMAEHFGATARTSHTCGCHVHVAIPDKESGIQVLGHLRPWLPALLTITANSAIADGYDTGYSSWRYQQWSRWPSAGPPPRFASLDEYESIVDGWLRAGSILDRAMIYWDVRLSEKQPTLEFRIADVAATPEEAVLLGVLARGLVATALAEDAPPPELSNEVLRAQLWRASREGATGCCPHPDSGDLVPTKAVLEDLITLTAPALEAAGDLEFAREGTTRLVSEGGGADRQRRRFAERSRPEDVVDLLTGSG